MIIKIISFFMSLGEEFRLMFCVRNLGERSLK